MNDEEPQIYLMTGVGRDRETKRKKEGGREMSEIGNQKWQGDSICGKICVNLSTAGRSVFKKEINHRIHGLKHRQHRDGGW